MKLEDFNIFKSFFEKNPDAQEAPDSIIEEKQQGETEPAENTVTIDDLMKELKILKSAIENNKPIETPKQDEQTKTEIDELRNSIKELTSEMQQANQRNSDLPKEETADDILRSFFTGGN